LPDTGGKVPPPAQTPSRDVLLDERAKPLSSEQFAALLGRWRDEGIRETRFLIGAADGHGEEARGKADLLLGFGAMTWPHLLVRAMLAEQLWRATSILAGHPYHRSG
jgi:23S rRNA (pseudouridine1915-N3)-methyltransferase